jgi:hypothetical protein
MRHYHQIGVLLSCLAVALLGCGSGTDYARGGSTQVVEMSVDDSTIAVGEGTVTKIQFTFNQNDVFFDNGEVNLVVRLPRQLSYRDNSAEIDLPGSRDRDQDPQVTRCFDGESFLVFQFDESDLAGVNYPLDSSSTQLKLTVDGKRVGSNLAIQAAADEGTIGYTCSQSFNFDEEQLIDVEPAN